MTKLFESRFNLDVAGDLLWIAYIDGYFVIRSKAPQV